MAAITNAQAPPPPPRITIHTIMQHAQEAVTAISEYDGVLLDLDEDNPIDG
jgi:hypothetical protein